MISYLRTFKHEVKKIYRPKEFSPPPKNKRHRKDKPHDDVHQ